MKKRIHLYQQLVSRYHRYQRKLQRIEEGVRRYRRKDLLVKRIKKLYERIMDLRVALRLATAGAALSAGMLVASPAAQGQNLTLKTDHILRIAHTDADAKPAFADIDEDGDLDLFLGGRLESLADVTANGIRYFRNDEGIFNEAASPFPDDLGLDPMLADTARISPAFVDVDNDGDMDSFLGLGDGTMAYFRNDGGQFTSVTGSENPFDGVVVGDSFNASPTFADIDGDGDMDAVIGKYDGLIAYFENNGDGTFTEQTGGANPFDGFNVTESATPAFADLDNDGDLDLYVGNKEGVIAFFENDGGTFTQVQGTENPFDGIDFGIGDEDNIAPAFADLDEDGDMDLFVGRGDGPVLYYRNDGGSFTWVPENTIGISYSNTDPNHSFYDYDGDGDLDCFTGLGDGIVYLYDNDGGQFAAVGTLGHPLDENVLTVDYFASLAFADIDGDGDMDAFTGSYQENIKYYRNDGGAFTWVTGMEDPFDGIDAGDDENISFVDWDGDGDMDAFIGNKAGEIRYFENTGGSFSEVTGSGNPFDGEDFTVDFLPNHITRVAFWDKEGDGDWDAYVGTVHGFIRVYENDGSGNLTELTGTDNPFDGMDFGRNAAPDFADIDGDGDQDMVIAVAKGLTFHFENTGGVSTFDRVLNEQTKVFPNPAYAALRIDMPWNQQEAVIRVTSLTGQVLREVNTFGEQATISLQHLPAGMYLLRITGEAGEVVKKVVKQ